MQTRTALRAMAILLGTLGLASGQALNQRVLVVYNTSFPDSLEVAQHYATQRGIPAANLCPITSTNAVITNNYTALRDSVATCLNTVGRTNILYIVMSYLTPYQAVPGVLLSMVDSYLSDIWNAYSTQHFNPVPTGTHGYYAETQAAGNVYPPFVPLATYRTQAKSQLIYSVWRLDAPTKELAKALVDRAIAAEALPSRTGNGCFDRRYIGSMTVYPDAGLYTGDWDIERGAIHSQMAGIPVITDSNDAEFGTAPAPLTCANALLYTGWYSYNNYNDAFTWNPGAIGWHVDSGSAINPRGGTNWASNAIQRGITITAGSGTEPYLQGLPRSGGVIRNLLEGANVGDAFLRNTRWLRWVLMFFGDPLYRPFPGGVAPFNAAIAENWMRLLPRDQVGGRAIQGTLQIASPAPAGGTTITLAVSRPALASAPSTVTVPQGAQSVAFTINTMAVTQAERIQITGSGPGVSLQNGFSLYPLLAAIRPSVATIKGGNGLVATVSLNDRALVGGTVVTLSTSAPGVAAMPVTVTVPAGTYGVNVPFTTFPVATNTPVTINATLAGVTVSSTLTVTP